MPDPRVPLPSPPAPDSLGPVDDVSPRGQRLALLGLVLLAFLAYGRTIGFDYCSDDFPLIHSACGVDGTPSLNSIRSFFFRPLALDVESRFFRPIWRSSYVLDAWSGARPALSHAFEVLLFAGIASSLFLLARELGLRTRTAWISAAFLLVSPVPVEAVAWVAGRTDLLAILGICFGLVLGLRIDRGRGGRFAWAGLVACSLVALLSKESGIVLGPALFAVLFWRATRRGIPPRLAFWKTARTTLWLALVSLGYLAWRAQIISGFLGGYTTNTFYDSFSRFVRLRSRTFCTFSYPFGDPVFRGFSDVLVGGGVLLLFAACLLLTRRTQRAGLWWLVFTLTVLGFVPIFKIDVVSADLSGTRHFLLPSIGWALALGLLLELFVDLLAGSRPVRIQQTLRLGLAALLLVPAFVLQQIRLGPYQEASRAMTVLRTQIPDQVAASGDSRILFHNLPELYGPAVCALNAFPSVFSPVFGYERNERQVFFLTDGQATRRKLDPLTFRILLGGDVRQIAFDRDRFEFVEAPFDPGPLVLKGAFELLTEGERCSFRLGHITLEQFPAPPGGWPEPGTFSELELAVAAPGAADAGRVVARGSNSRAPYRLVRLEPAEPTFASEVPEDLRFQLREAALGSDPGLLLGLREDFRPFALSGTLHLANPRLVSLDRDPVTNQWILPEAQAGAVRYARFAQVFQFTPDGLVLSELFELR